MDAWERWWSMAQGSLNAAQFLERQGEVRSSASRTYYAAYQAATALLLYHGLTPPEGREAWSHETTPELIRQMPSKLLKSDMGRDLALRLAAVYELRLAADCVGNADIETVKLREALKNTRFISSAIQNILPQKKA